MHENAGNIGQRMDYFQVLYENINVNIVVFGYRGYSDSDGKPSEYGIKMDAEAIVSYVMKEEMINQDLLFLQGRSLGGAVCIYTASQFPTLFKGMIVENTFTSMSDMVDHLLPWLRFIRYFVLRNKWASIDLV